MSSLKTIREQVQRATKEKIERLNLEVEYKRDLEAATVTSGKLPPDVSIADLMTAKASIPILKDVIKRNAVRVGEINKALGRLTRRADELRGQVAHNEAAIATYELELEKATKRAANSPRYTVPSSIQQNIDQRRQAIAVLRG